MKRKRAAAQKTPLTQTRISNFFKREEPSTAKRMCSSEKKENAESPDIILSTPPAKTSGKARKSLQKAFEMKVPRAGIQTDVVDLTEDGPSSTTKMNAQNLDNIGSLGNNSKLCSIISNPLTESVAPEIPMAQKPLNVDVFVGDDFDSAFFENTPPGLKSSEGDVPKMLPRSPCKPNNILKPSNTENIIPSFDDFGFDDAWGSEKGFLSPELALNFKTCVTCVVVSSELVKRGSTYEKIVMLKEKNGEKLGCVLLRDMWAFVEISNMDSVSVLAVKNSSDWVVNALQGYISLYPDFLISSTTIVGSMFCRRRGILSSLFKGLDSDSKCMTLGSLIHEMFQTSLGKSPCTEETMEIIVEDLMKSPNYLRLMYSCGMSLEETKNELKNLIPHVLKFMATYVTKETPPEGKNFRGVISEVVDIEENVSSVNLGFKGRIDVTVNVKINGATKRMPIELKTGRASFSTEHRCQVVLYTIMMTELGHKVDSGLLMYLKEGILEEIQATRVEIRDLIILRNDLVRYIRKFDPTNLPEPIRLMNACIRCPYRTVCTAYLDGSVAESHPIRSVTTPLEPNHLEYFHKWSKLLLLEDGFESDEKNNLKLFGSTLQPGCVKLKSEYKYSFQCEARATSLTTGSFVQIVPENGSRLFMGRIVQVTQTRCSVLVDKQIPEESGKVFAIEGYQFSLLSRYMTNLGTLMDEDREELRKIVVDKTPSKFAPKIPKIVLEKCVKILSTLNDDQQRAVLKVLACENYMLVEGPPGTGKTQTIVGMVKVLLALNQTVLLVGHTHSSVDNILLRLTDVDFIRMGNITNIHPQLHDKTYSNLSKNVTSVTQIDKLLSCPIVASTCLGLDADIVAKKKFDVCIIDESSQVLQPEAFKPLFAAKKFVLIGDPKQLRPVVKSLEAQKLGMNESIFERLFSPDSVVTLSYQYRMNETIMNLANNLTYEQVLKTGSEQVSNAVLELKPPCQVPWLAEIVSPEIKASVIFVDTSDYLVNNNEEKFSCANAVEAKLVLKIVEELVSCGVPEENLGVMAPFRAQIQILKDAMPSTVEVNTIDQYQGRDKECIVFSCTKQDRFKEDKGEYELLNDERRLTVAVTRAKRKLIIVGDKETLVKYHTFHRLFTILECSSFVVLKEGEKTFSWSLLNA